MSKHSSSDERGVGLIAFLLGGVVALALAIAVFLLLSNSDDAGRAGEQRPAATPSSGDR